ncbi:MAG: 1-phosphofructokinase, partial [Frankiales bacterium]|nr:1-phosphofructokinase [Frankiales bacterium]
MTVVTVTPNPSLDHTVEVDALLRGAVLRARGGRIDPGGKGVNVSRALAAHGIPTVAVLPSGGAEGAQLAWLLGEAGVDVTLVPVAGSVRANVSIVEPDGTVTKINEPGPTLTPAEVAQLTAATVSATAGSAWVVVSGSLPPGTPDQLYADLVQAVRRAGGRTAVDTSGPALLRALASRPALIKPNREELEEAVGRKVHTVGEAAAASRELLARGAGAVLASLGADGGVLVQPDGAWWGQSPVAAPVSSVGAG